ncbi:NAD(P)/FAD-dependent oxidoreductase [Vallitalea okinawensis]|uniref:NAD(P)/FAD-dependent oxidoreductase n=1 Tax=Vallitalea okinawensis TaxID=2078660 RepID=UPI000CFE1179|nr:hypothetical protein [Vallitalea okinawensis]
MIRLQQVKLPIDHTVEDLENKIRKLLRINKQTDMRYKIYRRSLDARKKDQLSYVYHIDVYVSNEEYYQKKKIKNLVVLKEQFYELLIEGTEKLKHAPVVIGAGPSGLLNALTLAQLGYCPILIERGKDVDERVKDVQLFWQHGVLNTRSNVQYGEGGAGTFSDGKLNTLVKDKNKRGRKVLEEFVKHGAPEEILYVNKPHIGTDLLRDVVKNIREEIIALGGQVRFNSQMTDMIIEGNRIKGIIINEEEVLATEHLIIGIGHSARDTFQMMKDRGVMMEAKSFAIGVRIEHPQEMIDKVQYGIYANHPRLGAADYKLKHQCSNGRGVYSFCMCPGGEVVGSASEEKTVVTNGMSYYKRDLVNANSALLVTITPHDFPSKDPLAGVEFQRIWEKKAFMAGGESYKAPIQLVGDLMKDQASSTLGDVNPSFSNGVTLTHLNTCLPEYVLDSLKEGITAFDKKIAGYGRYDAVLTGVESRSSSPIRILRDESFQSNILGLYPMGEGAGYAGGIMSAAMDGIKIAEYIAKNYCP